MRLHYLKGVWRFFIGFLVCVPALAEAAALPPAAILAQWQLLRDPNAPGIAFTDGYRFLTDYPNWPEEKTIRLRTEAAAFFENPDPAVMTPFCKNMPPVSGRGMVACSAAGAGDETQNKQWLHHAWIQGDFSEHEENQLLDRYGHVLTQTDNLARMERLLYEQRIGPAKRLLGYLPAARQPYFAAWIALEQNEKKTKDVWQSLPKAQQSAPGLLFARINNALDAKQLDTVVRLERMTPANVPYPDMWWPGRTIAVREAIGDGNYGMALAILAHHGDLKSEALSEALWLKGWITLQFKHDATTAYKDFHTLYTQVNTPVSRARAAYWAARAASKNGNADIARDWYQKAADNRTVFYGQLAYQMLESDAPLPLPEAPHVTGGDRQNFEAEPIVAATRQLHAEGDTSTRDRFLAHMVTTADTPNRMVMVADLARELNGIPGGVKAAKLALRKRVVMLEQGWPRIGLPPTMGVEPALALAIARQESEFDPTARSKADARGLMQLLPSTARHVAQKHDLPYSDSLLENPQQNILLGTTYLGQIIEGFDGSYILGIASYNAGPANVRRWIEDFGAPPNTVEGTVDWIESIPFSETRNYVMRVLENVEIYRTLDNPSAPLRLEQDLTR